MFMREVNTRSVPVLVLSTKITCKTFSFAVKVPQ
jgi:hypothetical protein